MEWQCARVGDAECGRHPRAHARVGARSGDDHHRAVHAGEQLPERIGQ